MGGQGCSAHAEDVLDMLYRNLFFTNCSRHPRRSTTYHGIFYLFFVAGWLGAWVGEWMDGWVGGRMDGRWMDGW